MDYRESLINVFKSDASLTAMLANADSIYGYYDDDLPLPAITVHEIDSVPSLTGDNDELCELQRLQVTAITDSNEYDDIEKRIRQLAKEIGLMRVLSTSYRDGDKYFRVIQFRVNNYLNDT